MPHTIHIGPDALYRYTHAVRVVPISGIFFAFEDTGHVITVSDIPALPLGYTTRPLVPSPDGKPITLSLITPDELETPHARSA